MKKLGEILFLYLPHILATQCIELITDKVEFIIANHWPTNVLFE